MEKEKYYLKVTPPMNDWKEVTEKEYKDMEKSCGFYPKEQEETATSSFGIIKGGIEISGRTNKRT